MSSTPGALVSMLLRLPKLKFVIVTLGEEGCLMVQRASTGTKPETLCHSLEFRTSYMILFPGHQHPLAVSSLAEVFESQEIDIESLLETLKHRKDSTTTFPTCVSSVNKRSSS